MMDYDLPHVYSQNMEEIIILDCFSRLGVAKGRFLDIGAFDGRTYSNTLKLAGFGWEGVCLEPHIPAFDALVREHAGRPGVTCLPMALVLESGSETIPFWCTDDHPVSTTDPSTMSRWGDDVGFRQTTAKAIAIDAFFEAYPPYYNFVSIDTEGTSVEIAKSRKWERVGAQVVCVEHDGREAELMAHFDAYRLAMWNPENLVFVRY